MGESGTRADRPRVEPFLVHDKTHVRRAALYALAWLDVDGSAEHFVAALGSERHRVSRDAANWLMRSAHLIASHESAVAALLESDDASVRRHAEEVLAAGREFASRWE
jgi:hypothetical protein